MEKIILEEIKKFKLLTNYNNELTLSENMSLNEAPQGEIEMITKGLARSAKELDGVFNAMSKDAEAVSRLSQAGIKDSKGLLSVIKKGGSTAESLLGDFMKGILKSTETTNEGLRTLAAKSLAESEAFTKTYAKELASGEDALRNSLKAKGYTKESIDALVRNSKFGESAVKSGEEVSKTAAGVSQQVSQNMALTLNIGGKEVEIIGKDARPIEQEVKDVAGETKKLKVTDKPKLTPSERKALTENIKKATSEANKIALMAKKTSGFWNIAKKAALIGIPIFAVWWFFFSHKDIPAPIDIPPTPPTPTPPTPPNPDPNSGRYHVCTGTYTQGCKTDPTGAIGQVQKCLGIVVDGKFWVRTQEALEAKGFADGFKDSDITTICGGTPPTPTPAPDPDTIIDNSDDLVDDQGL
jgi:hypothetical protein